MIAWGPELVFTLAIVTVFAIPRLNFGSYEYHIYGFASFGQGVLNQTRAQIPRAQYKASAPAAAAVARIIMSGRWSLLMGT